MRSYIWETAEEIDKALALRCKNIRKRKGITQMDLSKSSGVSYGSIKRFETTGEISLKALTHIAQALDCVDDIKTIFTNVPYKNIEEVIRENK